MKNNQINEEIKRIGTLMKINPSLMTEQSSALAKLILKVAPEVEGTINSTIEKMLGKGKNLSSITDQQLNNVLNDVDMVTVTKRLANKIYSEYKNDINTIFSKYNMSNGTEAAKAYNELQKIGIVPSLRGDVALAWKAEKNGASTVAGVTSSGTNPTPPKPSNVTNIGGPVPGQTTATASGIGSVDQKILQTYNTDPAFQTYYHVIDNISKTVGLGGKDTENMLLAFSKYGLMNPAELEQTAKSILKNRQLEKYGWLQKRLSQALSDPSKTIKIFGKTVTSLTIWTVITYSVVTFGATALGWATWLNKKIPTAPDSDTLQQTKPANGQTVYNDQNDPAGLFH